VRLLYAAHALLGDRRPHHPSQTHFHRYDEHTTFPSSANTVDGVGQMQSLSPEPGCRSPSMRTCTCCPPSAGADRFHRTAYSVTVTMSRRTHCNCMCDARASRTHAWSQPFTRRLVRYSVWSRRPCSTSAGNRLALATVAIAPSLLMAASVMGTLGHGVTGFDANG
jgi:hypothetical protein